MTQESGKKYNLVVEVNLNAKHCLCYQQLTLITRHLDLLLFISKSCTCGNLCSSVRSKFQTLLLTGQRNTNHVLNSYFSQIASISTAEYLGALLFYIRFTVEGVMKLLRQPVMKFYLFNLQ